MTNYIIIPIGGIFGLNNKLFKVEKAIDEVDNCIGCYFEESGNCNELIPNLACAPKERPDRENVIFKVINYDYCNKDYN